MAKVTDPRDLLVHKLAVVYSTEKTIEGMLPRLAREANNDELRNGFEQHAAETREQIQVLEQAFEQLGEKPRRAKALAVEGLELQHKAFAAEAADDVLPEVLDIEALSSAAATEHHEIAAYESLITLAQSLGAEELVGPLQQNLEQEQRMLGQVQGLAKRLGAAERGESEEREPESLAGELASKVRGAFGSDAQSDQSSRVEAER